MIWLVKDPCHDGFGSVEGREFVAFALNDEGGVEGRWAQQCHNGGGAYEFSKEPGRNPTVTALVRTVEACWYDELHEPLSGVRRRLPILICVRPRFPSYQPAKISYPPKILFDRLRHLDLTLGEYAVFGSGPLAVRGLLKRVGDLDVITRGGTWDRVKSLGQIVMYGADETVDLGNGLTFGTSWAYGTFDIDSLIDGAEILDGLPFVLLDEVAEFKRAAGRPKDLDHLALMEESGLI